jgi:3-oxoacyl-[acyl-carrier protein] reductase
VFSDFDEIRLGETRSLTKRITTEDVRKFVEMTGDDNPLHVDQSYAETTAFKEIVVHGMLGASFISTVIGTKLPGTGALWVSQSLEFLLPVRLNDELTISCTVLQKYDRDRILELRTTITNQNQQLVLTGVGRVKVLSSQKAVHHAEAAEGSKRVALVTGGAGGIGSSICLRFAAEGYAVVINYNGNRAKAEDLVGHIKSNKGDAIAVQADVSLESGVEQLVEAARQAFGAVDILVNNASARINPKSLDTMDWHDIQRQFDVGVKGAFLLSKACARQMQERKWGRIINITSQAIEGVPTVGWAGYTLSKAALSTLARHMAVEYGPHNITVNCVAPGMTNTAFIGDIPEKVQMMTARQAPLRRLATPEDVAGAVAFLASRDAQHISGHTLHVNGGLAM